MLYRFHDIRFYSVPFKMVVNEAVMLTRTQDTRQRPGAMSLSLTSLTHDIIWPAVILFAGG